MSPVLATITVGEVVGCLLAGGCLFVVAVVVILWQAEKDSWDRCAGEDPDTLDYVYQDESEMKRDALEMREGGWFSIERQPLPEGGIRVTFKRKKP